MPIAAANQKFADHRKSGIRIPRLALRQRSEEHPMAMFFLIVATAFAAAALISPSGAALVSLKTEATAPLGTAGKVARLPASETDIACRGQAWGAEIAACLAVIASEAGRGEDVRIRIVVAARTQATTPNVF